MLPRDPHDNDTSEERQAALLPPQVGRLVALGRSLIPVGLDKRPLVIGGQHLRWGAYQATRPNESQIHSWARLAPPSWAQVTGAISKVVTIDFDGEAGERLIEHWGVDPHRKTPHGGHLDVVHPGWPVPTLNGKAAEDLGRRWPGLDIKGDGGYAIVFGRSSAGEYHWLRDPEPDPLSVIPVEVWDFLAEAKERTLPPPADRRPAGQRVEAVVLIDRATAQCGSSGRNVAGFWLACQLRDQGYTENEAEAAMQQYVARVPSSNLKGSLESYSWPEARASLSQAYRRPPREPWSAQGSGVGRTRDEGALTNAGTSEALTDEPEDYPPDERPLYLLSERERAAVARETLLDRYITVMSSRTDAPEAFHEAVGLAILSVLLGRRVKLSLATGDVYPSLWILIVAPSTRYRKSTAQRLGKALLLQVAPGVIAPQDFSPQRFVAVMAERDGEPTLFHRDEFSGFYRGVAALDWMAGLREALMIFLDGDPYRRELQRPKGKEVDESQYKFVVDQPFLSILGGTTREGFIDVAVPSDIANGFLPRYLFYIPDHEPVRRPVRELTPEDEVAMASLRVELERLRDSHIPPIRLGEGVLTRWNELHDDLTDDASQDEEQAVVHERLAANALRIAVLLAGVGDGVIDLPILYRAISIVEARRATTVQLLRDIAPSREEKKAQRLLDLVVRSGRGGVDRTKVMRTLRLSKREMDSLQETLEAREQIRVEFIPRRGRSRAVLKPTTLSMQTMQTNRGTGPSSAEPEAVEYPREFAYSAKLDPSEAASPTDACAIPGCQFLVWRYTPELEPYCETHWQERHEEKRSQETDDDGA